MSEAKPKVRAIEITGFVENAKCYGFWKTLWGWDIWFDKIPFLKCLVLTNIIVWILIS